MLVEGQAYADTTAVVLYLQKLHSAIFDRDADRRGASVKTVFKKFLER